MRRVHRIWGWYLTLLSRKHYKVKLLRFHREKACSLQYHNHRHELWLFLTGGGKFKNNTEQAWVEAGEWMSVPVGAYHRFFASMPTYVLEIQYGDICSEEDIVRI